MKRELLILLFSIMANVSFSQGYSDMLAELDGKYEKDSDRINFTQIIEVDNVSAQELYNRVLPFFFYHYKSNEAEIQIADKDNLYIIANGSYRDVTNGFNAAFGYSYHSNAEHTLRIDFKDDRLRAIVSVKEIVEYKSKGYGTDKNYFTIMYPARPKQKSKTSNSEKNELQMFYKTYVMIKSTFRDIEKYANKDTGNDDW